MNSCFPLLSSLIFSIVHSRLRFLPYFKTFLSLFPLSLIFLFFLTLSFLSSTRHTFLPSLPSIHPTPVNYFFNASICAQLHKRPFNLSLLAARLCFLSTACFLTFPLFLPSPLPLLTFPQPSFLSFSLLSFPTLYTLLHPPSRPLRSLTFFFSVINPFTSTCKV